MAAIEGDISNDNLDPLEILAVIPARGGSKGIPHKNVKHLLGKPLISYTIEAALKAQCVDRVIVSTDDDKITHAAVSAGAEVVRRPAKLSTDTATSESALLHVLERLAFKEDYRPNILVFLQCTSPLTRALDIDLTVNKLFLEHADTSFTVSPFHYFIWRKNIDGSAVGINHDKRWRLRRQEREEQYIETGAVYAMRVDGFLKNKHRFFGNTAFHVVQPERCVEIDEPIDWKVASAMMQFLQKSGSTYV